MEIKIIKKEIKPLLAREEYETEIESASTPSNADLKKAFSEKFKKDESLISIKKIYQKFGTKKANVCFNIYSDPEKFKKFETKKEKKAKQEQAK